MIIVNMKGGLGNQLFQYAAARALALHNGDTLKLEVAGLERANAVGDIYRPFGLGEFNIDKQIASAAEVQKLKYPYGVFSKVLRFLRQIILKQTNTLWDPAFFAQHGDLFLDGYWQSPKYFESIRETLLAELTLARPLSAAGAAFAAQIKNTTAVALHVRRGDYIKNLQVAREFGPCTLPYYQAALAEIEKVVPEPTYFVFSDDLPWVKEHLPVGERAVFVKGEGMTDVEDLVLMSMCQHNIIANSSFSWWAAWLNRNPGKIVLAPGNWFRDRACDTRDLFPPGWRLY